MLNRTTPPPASTMKALRLPAFEERRLDNGLPVYLLPYGSQEVMQLQWIFRAGTNYQTHCGLASYTLRNLQEGTRQQSALQIAQALDQYGAWMGHDIGEETVVLKFSALSRQLPQMLPLLSEVIMEPLFPEQGFMQMKARSRQNILTSAEKTTYPVQRQFGHLLYGEQHPYGRHFGLDELDALQLPLLLDFHRQYLQPANSMLAISGRYDEATVLRQLNATLGQLPPGERPTLHNFASQSPSNQIGSHHIFREGPQSTVRLGHLSLPRRHPDFDGMRVLLTLLGGFFGSRLMKKVREEKGYTYSIYAGSSGNLHHGHLVIQTDVGNEYVDPTLTVVREEMQRLQDQAPAPAEIDLVRNYMMGQSVNTRETPFQMADILQYHLATGISFAELDNRYEIIQAITSENIRELAAKWLKPDAMLEIVCGGTR